MTGKMMTFSCAMLATALTAPAAMAASPIYYYSQYNVASAVTADGDTTYGPALESIETGPVHPQTHVFNHQSTTTEGTVGTPDFGYGEGTLDAYINPTGLGAIGYATAQAEVDTNTPYFDLDSLGQVKMDINFLAPTGGVRFIFSGTADATEYGNVRVYLTQSVTGTPGSGSFLFDFVYGEGYLLPTVPGGAHFDINEDMILPTGFYYQFIAEADGSAIVDQTFLADDQTGKFNVVGTFSEVPEPASMLILGALSLASLRRRRR